LQNASQPPIAGLCPIPDFCSSENEPLAEQSSFLCLG